MSALVTLDGGQFTIYNLSTQLVKPNDLTYFELSARNKFALRVGKGTKDSFSRCNISNHRVTKQFSPVKPLSMILLRKQM